MARIRRFTSRVDAEMAASMLLANGIDARVMNDDTGGMHPNLAFGLGTSEVIVHDDDLEAATALLDAAQGSSEVGPDEATGSPTRLWLQIGAVLLVLGIVAVVVVSDLELRWF